nr:hypothetical protein [Planctomycetota bacterium]
VELLAWPDSVTIIMEIIPKMTMEKVSFGLELKSGDKTLLSSSSRVIPIPEGRTTKYSQTVTFSQEETGSLKMAALDEKGKVLETRYDKILNAYVIDVPPDMLKKGKMGDEPIAVNLKIKNPTEDIQTARLFFSTEPRGKECAIVGTTPFLADSQGNPLGVAMQISKNWHRQPDHKILYEGSWYYAYAVLHAQPGKSYGLKYMILNGVWGDVPSVSHAQLCLIGWGGNQLWDQVAIGNWGETITYDPEVGLNRAVIDDVRPLMVSSIGSKPNVKWGWTNNVGGGDFLVYVDKEGKRQPVVAAKSNYQMIGPNLSKVTYSGFTADKAIACKMTVMTPRCDDINRNWHSFRYDVLKPVEFSRLAFYQMGADRYNDNAFDYMAVGDSKGLSKQFEPVKGGLEYSVKNEKCGNKLPWLAIYGAGYVGKTENRKGAVANRGLIVRSWKAKLSGREISAPSYSVYGTEDQAKSALFELSAPSSVKKLLPGDFVECEVEFIVLPQFADDYYGPNENLKKFLKENENTWKPVYREAVGNDLDVDVSVGKLIKLYPVEIELGTEQKATFKVAGGIGYVPMIFSGLKDYKGMKLLEIKNGERVDCRDNERYQSNYDIENQTWSVIFNIDLDTQADNRMEREFEFVTGG